LQHLKFLLSGIFVLAKNRGLFDGENPVRDAMLPSRAHGPGETHAYELEQILAMLRLPFTAATKAAIAVAGFAGLRESEIRGLRWDDYDGSEITVRRSIDRTDGKAHPPKSVKSAASVPVISQLRLLLDAHKKTAKPGPWIFPGIEQETCDFDKLAQRTIKPVLTAAGLQWRGWHAFRRGLGTNLLEMHVDPMVIQRILRHSNLNVTLAHYVKVRDPRVDAAMAQLEAEVTKSDTVQ